MLDYKFKIGEIKIIKQYQDIDWKKIMYLLREGAHGIKTTSRGDLLSYHTSICF
jgi:hypothetical protein